ncbi:hypothetical protein SAY87_015482 [Trapa incisa]|uniref:Protein TIFY n=1 Tax=Trapa incisa TaxID=236973 RepID=A0AAN7JE37_9MYRT|nr:hypothetical protein SAY87_015482 [Trapa incisa]
MRKNCNLRLQLQPSDLGSLQQRQPIMEDSPDKQQRRQQDQQQVQQQLTIFYNGRVCVCHVDESQARTIITLANNAAAGSKITRSSDREEEEDTGVSPRSRYHRTNSISHPYYKSSSSPSPTTVVSMKRSLQRFLQERRHRILDTSPYNVR